MPPSFKFYTCSVGMFLILKHQEKILQNRFHKQSSTLYGVHI